MKDRIVLITGSTDGIGKQTAISLAEKGASVLVHGKDKKRGESSVKEIKNISGNENIDLFIADFSSMKQVKDLASEIKAKYDRLDVLVNNAGVYMNERVVTEDGYEATFAINYLAHFLLTHLLLPLIKKSDNGRIINVSSVAHQRAEIEWDNLHGERSYNAYNSYAVSKLGNILFTKELANRIDPSQATVNAVHPGVVSTKLLRSGLGITGGDVREGAETIVYLAVSSEIDGETGKYFKYKKESDVSSLANNKNLIRVFWDLSEELTGLKEKS